MIIIAKQEELLQLEKQCNGNCDTCVLGHMDYCPIDEKRCIIVDNESSELIQIN
jgi:hypothetical protein